MQIQLRDDGEYLYWLHEVKKKIRSGQVAAALAVNKEMLQVWWEIGAFLSEKQRRSAWGD